MGLSDTVIPAPRDAAGGFFGGFPLTLIPSQATTGPELLSLQLVKRDLTVIGLSPRGSHRGFFLSASEMQVRQKSIVNSQ